MVAAAPMPWNPRRMSRVTESGYIKIFGGPSNVEEYVPFAKPQPRVKAARVSDP